MPFFWITFTDGTFGSCEGNSAYDAKRIAEHLTGKKVEGPDWKDFKAEPIPYLATPVIFQYEHPVSGKSPAFCHSPLKCKGNTSCPQSRSCTE